MLAQTLLWLYLINTILTILHEMDSAYWKEWDVFGMDGDIAGFLWMHIPIYALQFWSHPSSKKPLQFGYF
ncbi:MAG: DUF6713 family protein [Chloroflexota bacterium]